MKSFELALVMGRFQFFHKGHMELIEKARLLADKVVVCIGSQQESGTKENPFDVWMRQKMINKVYRTCDCIEVFGIDDLDNDSNERWGEYLLSKVKGFSDGKMPDLMVYGDDKSRTDWFDDSELKTISRFIISRTSNDGICATMLRKGLAEYDVYSFKELFGKHYHGMIDLEFLTTLKNELLKVPYYRELWEAKQQ